VAALEEQLAVHLILRESSYSACRRTAYVTDYESVCADVGDAGSAQQRKLVSLSKVDFRRSGISLGMSADCQQRQNQQRNRKQFHILPPSSFSLSCLSE
jgi:hypothetical protein